MLQYRQNREWYAMAVKKILKNNAIVRLFFSYLGVLLLVIVTCLTGLGRALDIVEENTVRESNSLLRQGCSDMDYLLKNIYSSGMKLASSQKLKELGNVTDTDNINYYYRSKAVMKDFEEALKYLDSEVYQESFIYVNGIERFFFQGGIYRSSVFDGYLTKWEVNREKWADVCEGNQTVPGFYVTDRGELFYYFPCTDPSEENGRIATVFFHIDKEILLEKMQFLQDYSVYSIFLVQDGTEILGVDGFGGGIPSDVVRNFDSTAKEQVTPIDGQLVLKRRSDSVRGDYILVLPENEAFAQIEGLKLFVFISLGIALISGIGFAVYYAIKTGKPINNIAKKINDIQNDAESQNVNTDLKYLDATIEQIIEQQKSDKGALQQSFFHNLLKGDFVSRPELEYMAKRAGISLIGKEYYAVAVRLFPQIDADHIDGQTVEEARALQQLLGHYLQTRNTGSLWSYKRSTLVFQYIMEEDGVEDSDIREKINNTAEWLKEVHHVDSCWGISTVCRDLMNFWRNAQEAQDALQKAGRRESVLSYSEAKGQDKSFYLPYSMEDHLAQGLRSGDFEQVGQTLDILKEENLLRRKLDRGQFLKLSRRISDILAAQCAHLNETDESLIRLNGILIENRADSQNEEYYFEELKQLCYRICGIVVGQKSLKRNNKIKSILKYMEDNFDNTGMGLSVVSEQFGLSEGYLSALFKEEMNVNFADYLEDLRMKEACRLLKEGVLVADIAERTGYNSVQSFRRAFKRVLGVSPSEYRTE